MTRGESNDRKSTATCGGTRRVRGLILLLTLLVCRHAAARAEEPAALSLREALRLARELPPRVALARANMQRARAALHVARGAYLPQLKLEASGGVGYDNRNTTPNKIIVPAGVPPDQRDDFLRNARTPRYEATTFTTQGNLTVDYALIDRSRSPAVASAARDADADARALDDIRRLAQLTAAESYLVSLGAEALLEDARLTVARRSEQVAAITRLVQAGVRPSVDRARAEIDLVAARHGVTTRAVEVAAARTALAVAIGVDPATSVLPAPLDDAAWPAPIAPDAARAQAIARRPELAQREAALAAQDAALRGALAARRPTLGLLGAGNLSHADIWSGTGIQGVAYGASGFLALRWAALEPSVWRRADSARAARDVAEAALTSSVLDVRATATEAAFAVARTRAQLDQTTEVLATAEIARSAQAQRYRAGIASLLELLDAESIAQTARRERIEAERDHRLARVRLLAEADELDQLAR